MSAERQDTMNTNTTGKSSGGIAEARVRSRPAQGWQWAVEGGGEENRPPCPRCGHPLWTAITRRGDNKQQVAAWCVQVKCAMTARAEIAFGDTLDEAVLAFDKKAKLA